MPALFGPLYRAGWHIKFAHRTFAWDSEAPGKAAVHCVIVGFTRDNVFKPRLWDYPKVNLEPVEALVHTGINAYLVDGPEILVKKRSKPLAALPPALRGPQPTEGGNLIVEPADYEEVAADPVASKYLRPFRGSKELVRGLDRWCLWLEDASPSEISQSKILHSRVQAVKEMRESAKPTGDAFKLKAIPHLFRPCKDRPTTDYLCIPSVVSETRPYFTAAQLSGESITSNLAFTVEDPSGFAFGLISSSMFITWQRAVGGRLKSDLRFSNTLTWNTFPVPELDNKQREAIIKAGEKVLEARALHPERSLAEHYSPLAMAPELLKAHDALDKAVDTAFGAPRKLTTEKQRLELLFKNYEELTS